MRLDALGRHAEGDGPLHRLDARVKLLAALAMVTLAVLTPFGAWRLLAAQGLVLALLVGLSGVPVGALARRWLAFQLLVGFLAVMVARAHPEREALGFGPVLLSVLARNALALVTLLLLSAVTPFRRLLGAMGQLGLPPVMVSTLLFMHRFLLLLADELGRMARARRSRSFRRSGRLEWLVLTGMVGQLFLRAFERGERVQAAMLARGFDGTVGTLGLDLEPDGAAPG